MKAPAAWIVIEKRSAPLHDGTIATLIPTSVITEVSTMTNGTVLCDLRIKCSTGSFIILPSNLYREAAEALGIMEALGQNDPNPEPLLPVREEALREDGRRYRALKALFSLEGTLELWTDDGDVCIKNRLGLFGRGSDLDNLIDHRRTKV